MGLLPWAGCLHLTCCGRVQVVVAQPVTLFRKVELVHRHLQHSKGLPAKSHNEERMIYYLKGAT